MGNFSSKIFFHIQKLKRKPWFIVIAMLGSFLVAVVAFTDALEKIYLRIYSPFHIYKTELNGYWLIDETDKTYETYIKFQNLGDKIVGSTTAFFNEFTVYASGMPVTVPLYDVEINGTTVSFFTKRIYTTLQNDLSKDYPAPITTKHTLTYHYQGEIMDSKINFFITSVGGNYYDEVIAKKLDADNAKSLIKTRYYKKYGKKIEDIP